MSEEAPFRWRETGFGSLELSCSACGAVVASDLPTKSAMIYRGLLHTRECRAGNAQLQSAAKNSESERTKPE
jgi:hypothetical protein